MIDPRSSKDYNSAINDIIKTKTVGAGFAEVEEDFVLFEEPMSRLVFHAQIHEGGIRGKIIRQRRESATDQWIPDEAIDIRELGKKESINIQLKTVAVKNLYNAFIKLSEIIAERGIEYGENEYAVVNPNSVVISDENKITYIKKLLSAGYDEDIWASLVEENPSLATKLSYAQVRKKKESVVEELSERLSVGGFHETSGSDSWQKWIYKHNWLFGVNYQKPFEKTKINITGVMPDYLFPKLDRFVDILEIKLPEDEVILIDPSHSGSWKFTAETNKALGQVINYLGEIDRLRLEIEKGIYENYNIEICMIKPHAYILIGNSSDWSDLKKQALRKINNALHGVEILTYSDLRERGNQAIQLLTEDNS